MILDSQCFSLIIFIIFSTKNNLDADRMTFFLTVKTLFEPIEMQF